MAAEVSVDTAEALNKLQKQLDAETKNPHTNLLNLSEDDKAQMKRAYTALEQEEKVPAKDLPDQSTLWRFMEANSFNPTATVAHYKKYLKWRADNNVDNIANREIPQRELLHAVIPYAMHGFAKNGSPLYIEKTGRVHTWATSHLDMYQFELNHIAGVEEMMRRLKESSQRLGRPAYQVMSIIDLDGLGLGHRHAVGLLQAATQLDSNYYPSIIGDVYIVNCPWIVPGLWEVVKSFLPSSTITKLHVLGSDYKEKLRALIDAEQLPEEYGGTCKCPGGCIKMKTEAEVKQILLKDHTGLQLVEKYVGAGEKFEVVLEGEPGDEFKWSFDVDSGYDINFGVEMKPLDGGATVTVKIPGRCNTSKGQYTTTAPCTLSFLWDNSYSYFNGKNLKYHASVANTK